MRPLTRTAAFGDYPGCASVANWQQALAYEAYVRWADEGRALVVQDVSVECYNWGAASFHAPGPDAVYFDYHDPPPSTRPLAAVYALSVLDRVDAPLRFLRLQAERLLPGGLLVCTFAAWDATGDDCAVGHELRHRIYNRYSWGKLVQEVKSFLPLDPFGGVDLHYRGDLLGDHTLASLVLVKLPRRI